MKEFSRDICNSEIVLLTGAGASAPLGLRLMTSFMDLLENKVGKKSAQLMSFLRLMYESKTLPDKTSRRDLELVIEKLDDYQKFISLVKNDDYLWGRFSQIQQYKECKDLVNSLDLLTRNLIFEHYSKIDDKVVDELYTDFLTLLVHSNGNRFLPVFTTNYDQAIERFVSANSEKWSLIDGFENRTGQGHFLSLQSYNKYTHNTSNNKTDIVLFKLHGSIFWYKDKDGGEVFRMPHSSLMDPTLENILLYPAQTKNTLIEPFKTCYDYLGECLANCKVCVVVGHSFRDPYILEKIKLASKVNKSLALLVIDPRDVEKNVPSNIDKHCKWVQLRVGFGDIKEENALIEFEKRLKSLLF